jgi:uncharacterized protein (DUF58 family)
MSEATASHSTREILKKVRTIEIKTRRLISESMMGAYQSAFKGQGIDFEEVREYMPGDDVRSIDWNVTAKMDKPFIKRYREERELSIVLAVDLSASNSFGSTEKSKRELAAELGAVLAFSATRNNDKIGLLLFTDKVEKYIPPNKGRQHVLRVIRDILFYKPEEKGTDIVGALGYLNRLQKRKAVVFLLSDFITEESLAWIRPSTSTKGDLMKSLTLTNQRHDLICVDISDPRETELPNVGIVTLEDAETGELVEIDTGNRKLRQLYTYQNQKRLERMERGFRQSGVDRISISTDEHYINSLRSFFERREHRR